MKTRHLTLTAVLLTVATLFAGCGNDTDDGSDMIWDIYPFVARIALTDESGNNLLNPDTPGSMAKQRIFAIYKGRSFEKDSLVRIYNEQTRAYMAVLTGLKTMEANGKYYLEFGEFDGAKNYQNDEIILDYNDGSKKDTITFDHTFNWVNNAPSTHTEFRLNGKKVENTPIIIVKQRKSTD